MLFADTVGHLLKEKYDSSSRSFKTRCPACDSDQWSMDNATGKGRCFKCDERGSFAIWLTKLWRIAKQETKADEYLELQKLRRIPASIFDRAGVAKSPITGEWWLPTTPTFSRTGVKVLRPVKNKDTGEWKKRWFRLKGLSDDDAAGTSFLYQPMMSVAECRGGTIYLCEGEWDSLALWHLLEKENEKNFAVVGSPGASSFNAGYARFFSGKPVNIVGQNDEAGKNFVENSAAQLFTFVPSVASFKWEAFEDEGKSPALNEKRSKKPWEDVKDVNDVLWAAPKDTGVFSDSSSYAPIKTFGDRKAKIKRESLQEIYDDLGSYLKLTEAHKKMLRVMLATFVSSRYKGTPIWIFVHGPSGCGKTEILETLAKHQDCFSVSRVTRASLVSGRSGESDPSLLPRLRNKAFAIKDYTVLLNMAPAELDGVNSIFRDIFDGSGVFGFGGHERSYKDLYFSTIACCTDAILKRNDTTLGERFLMLDALDRQQIDVRELLKKVVKDRRKGEEKFTLKRLSQLGISYFIDYLWTMYPEGPPNASEDHEDRIIELAQVVTMLRAVVPDAESGGYRFRQEVGTRAAATLHRLLEFLGMVHLLDIPDENCWDDLRSVARSSMNGWAFDICESLFLNEDEGMTASEVAKRIVTTPEQVRRKLNDLKSIGAVRSKGTRSTGRTDEKNWRLHPDFFPIWKGAHLSTPESQSNPLYRRRLYTGTLSDARPDRHLKIVDSERTPKKRRLA